MERREAYEKLDEAWKKLQLIVHDTDIRKIINYEESRRLFEVLALLYEVKEAL